MSLFPLLIACRSEDTPQLRVLTWTQYFDQNNLRDFENSHHVRIKLDYFSSNEELLAKVKANVESGGKGYDLVLPTDYVVPAFVRLNLLQTIDHSKLTFLKDFSKDFLHPAFDPELKHVVPFAYGTTGIAVNTRLLPNFSKDKGISWKEFFENPTYHGKVTLLNDIREVFEAALLALGKRWSSATPADLEAAYAYLQKHRSQIRLFADETPPVLMNNECTLCQVYSGDARRVMAEQPHWIYLMAQEGATLWSDNFAIPKNAQHVDLAYAFMNAMLSEKAAADFTNTRYFATPQLAARKHIQKELLESPGVFPLLNLDKKLQFMKERIDLLQIADRLWTQLKSQH